MVTEVMERMDHAGESQTGSLLHPRAVFIQSAENVSTHHRRIAADHAPRIARRFLSIDLRRIRGKESSSKTIAVQMSNERMLENERHQNSQYMHTMFTSSSSPSPNM